MKAIFLRMFLAISVFDIVLGLVIALCIAFGVTGPSAWRGSGMLLFAGTGGVLWVWRARRQGTREVSP